VSASAVAASAASIVPHALDRAEIAEVLAHWKEAALRSADAGYDIIDVHAARGYLIHQFLSPLINQRADGYGACGCVSK
jgi:2,4-dienoyl-CoA reductase-like NADH-dependent reductase (Old Yellow Enzyme family)